MTENPKENEALLGEFFDASRARTPPLPEALAERVLADAERLRARQPVRPAARRSGFGGVLRALGGWPSIAGLAAASAAGLWIGVAAPDLYFGAVGAGYDLSDLMPGYATATSF